MAVHKLDSKVYFGQKALIEKSGKILVLRDPMSRVDGQTGVDFPGGKYRWGGSLAEELKREVKEETNLEVDIGLPFFVWTNNNIKYKIEANHLVRVGYICFYKRGKVKLSDEHDKFEWVDSKTYKNWEDSTGDFKALETYFRLKGS